VFQDAVPYGPAPVGRQMKRRNVVAAWIGLPLITLGIYHLVWYYMIHAEMKEFDPRETKISPVGSLLTVLFGGLLCGIPPLVSYYTPASGSRTRSARRDCRRPATRSSACC
jgi:hypothetical protein